MRNIYNLKKEAYASPSVGIFWIFKGQIIEFSEDVRSLTPISGYITSNYNHDAYWKQMQSLYPELKPKEYYEIPRGRVNYVSTGIYNILLPKKESQNKILAMRIARIFALPFGKWVVMADEHYDPPETADFE